VWTRQQHRWAGASHRRPLELEQYLAIRYTDTLTSAGAVASVGRVGDSFDNALAESTIGKLKTELIKRHGPSRTLEQLEFALFEYIDWWNHRRLHGQIGLKPPVEAEAEYYSQHRPQETAGSQ
jgi:putative transposase